jgi:hypothetical protein
MMQNEMSDRLPYFGAPPPREPRPARSEPALRGKRVILSMPDGFVYDMRAVSEVHPDADGKEVIDIVSEEGYFRWMFTGERPSSKPFPPRLVWVE